LLIIGLQLFNFENAGQASFTAQSSGRNPHCANLKKNRKLNQYVTLTLPILINIQHESRGNYDRIIIYGAQLPVEK